MTNVTRSATVNLRISEATRDLIDRAAAARGKSRSEFMLDAARREAEDALLDQCLYLLDEAAFEAFAARLDMPTETTTRERLAKTLKTAPPWAE